MNQVRPNALLAMLNKSDEAQLFSQLVSYPAERHTILQRAGEPTDHVYFPTSGMISFLTVMRDGEAVETASVGYDNAAGYNTALSGRNANCQLIVQLSMKSYRIGKAEFSQAYEHSVGVRHMIHAVMNCLSSKSSRVLPATRCTKLNSGSPAGCCSPMTLPDRTHWT